MPKPSRQPDHRQQRAQPRGVNRLVVFAVLCGVCVLAVAVYGVSAIQRNRSQAAVQSLDAPASPAVLASVVAQPHVVFLHSPTGDAYRRVAVVPLDSPDGQRYLTELQCQRVYHAAGQGLCLGNNYVAGVASSYTAFSFDQQFNVTKTYDAPGIPTRARLSSNGGFGSLTVFVTGHSYSDVAFSTSTTLVDTASGQTLTDLEQFAIERDGAPFQSVDFNFWGVTFARDNDHFYATLGTGGKTYLIEGAVSTRQAKVLMENVECPSLSPDNTRLVFKQRTGSDSHVWRLMVLDLSSMTLSAVPGEERSIDDQAEWLDDTHILYDVQQEGSLATDIWEAALDGSAPPHVFIPQAMSPAVVH